VVVMQVDTRQAAMNDETDSPSLLAKITWVDPQTGVQSEYPLVEGASITIGRSSSNDIAIPDRHVSRQHAIVTYRDGIFMINDLESANGTFVNDEMIREPFPLMSGDVIRLYVPTLKFVAAVEGAADLSATGQLTATDGPQTGYGELVITNGPQKEQIVRLLLEEVVIGRATSNATWEIGLQDTSVSRPHARMERRQDVWMLFDLGSSNGTFVNGTPVSGKGRALKHGDVITFGGTTVEFHDT
jgi:pSer/pThr/pTyr-binding forkhead associated (FHA) protein